MVPAFAKDGTSFKGVTEYLTHDKDHSNDNERVAWTHTLNLANDHIPSAVDEMLWTYRDAETLKQEAGVRPGGTPIEKPVKHFSLNWAPDQDPSREQMIETAEDFLRHMKWDEHQAYLVAHNDKEYSHIHVVLNAVHPITGLKLDDSLEKVRAQEWALSYEREHGRIYCENRLEDQYERGPTRPAWMAFKEQQTDLERHQEAQRDAALTENGSEKSPENVRAADWKLLKEIQRNERETFFAEGKQQFQQLRRDIYSEVREEFRDSWAEYYSDFKNDTSTDELAARKAELISQQSEILKTRRDEACSELKDARDGDYKELLQNQMKTRTYLGLRQAQGLDMSNYLDWVANGRPTVNVGQDFKDAANEITSPRDQNSWTSSPPLEGPQREDSGRVKSGVDVTANIGEDLGFGAISIFESLIDGFVGAKPTPEKRSQPPPSAPSGPDPFEKAVADGGARQTAERERDDEEWRKRQRSPGE